MLALVIVIIIVIINSMVTVDLILNQNIHVGSVADTFDAVGSLLDSLNH